MGIGFRIPIAKWTLMNLRRFDVLEVTVDHYVKGGEYARKTIANLVGRIPLVLHGVGLSLGTDAPLDDRYVDEVAQAIDELKVPSYSEHLAWTKVPGLDLANLLPVPRTRGFFDHLRERWLQDSRTPPWVADVASIELALARARTLRPTTMGREALTTCPKGSRWYRTHPCTLLVRCGYDVWNLFEPRKSSLSAAHLQAGEAITQRDMHLAVAAVVGRRRPLVLEVTPEAFLLLERSTDWSRLGRNSASRDEGTDEETLVLQLAAQGLVLVSGEASRDGGRG